MATIMQRCRSAAKKLFSAHRRSIPVTALAGAIGAGLCGVGLWWYEIRPSVPMEWQGYAEADFVKVGPTQQGLVTAVYVGRGDRVAMGAPLFAQDDASDRAARDQAVQQLGQAQEQLDNLEAAGKPTEIKQAEQNLADNRATLDRSKLDFGRNEAMVGKGFISIQAMDQSRANYLSAMAKVAGMEAALAQIRAPLGRDREIKAQRATVEAARAALAMVEWRLSQRRVSAPATARVADVLARPGETLAAGAPVVSLLPPGNIFVRFFIPEKDLANISLGDPVTLICDGCRPNFLATVSFIAPQAEYTPPVIYSESSRAKLVYTIEARPNQDQAPLINPGQPVSVRPMARSGAP
jgi:HlyD family secretion protein